MKAPNFWYKPTGFLALSLLPLAGLYRLAGYIRRLLAIPYKAKIPVICIGNIVAGGAGKTPTALFIADLLKQKGAKPIFVTRGYGGLEHGPLQVDLSRHTVSDVGDEALLLARTAPVWIGRDRAATIRIAEHQATHIILDDGLQNPHIQPEIAFLVIDAEVGLGNNKLIPSGPLREPLETALKRITALIMIGDQDTQDIAAHVHCPVLSAHISTNLPADFPKSEKFLAFAGIGRPEKFYDTCRKAGLTISRTQNFPDHHVFTENELEDLKKRSKAENSRLLTTEKDWVRLPLSERSTILTLPIQLTFENKEAVKRLLGL